MNPDPPRTGPIVLGLFILGQIFFLVASNLLGFLANVRDDAKDSPPAEAVAQAVETVAPGWMQEAGHLHDAQRIITSVLKPWAQITGQPQSWSLFAPDVSRDVCFPAVEFRWEGDSHAPVIFLSDNEPADTAGYFRFGQFRIRRFEGQLDVVLSPDASPEEWRETIRKRVDSVGTAMRYYLVWRWREYERRHPGRPQPTEIILLMRCYQIRSPDETPPYWDEPRVHPIARLCPPQNTLKAYNPETEKFEAP
jgi:hypothetical protein